MSRSSKSRRSTPTMDVDRQSISRRLVVHHASMSMALISSDVAALGEWGSWMESISQIFTLHRVYYAHSRGNRIFLPFLSATASNSWPVRGTAVSIEGQNLTELGRLQLIS
jgi:hypothetical protein